MDKTPRTDQALKEGLYNVWVSGSFAKKLEIELNQKIELLRVYRSIIHTYGLPARETQNDND